MSSGNSNIKFFGKIDSGDVSEVGGKNASLGEMISSLKEKNIKIPDGFATTAKAYREFIEDSGIDDLISSLMEKLKNDEISLEKAGKQIRRKFLQEEFTDELEDDIRGAYDKLCEEYESEETDVAVRSSATAEDLPEASFAGQQESYLNVRGKDELIDACRKCFASLFTNRAISYREEQGFDHLKVALSVGVQKMIRSDKSGSGVMFTLDTDTGFKDVILINAAWGLGENVVQGSVTPDEYMVFKPLIDQKGVEPVIEKELGSKEKKMIYSEDGDDKTRNVETSQKERNAYVLEDHEIQRLASWAALIEEHYEKPMDIEWAKDGPDGDLYILQARPETVQSQKKSGALKSYKLKEKSDVIAEGVAIGEAIATGEACILESAGQIDQFEDDAVLVTGRTDPDWVPIMKKASAIVTEYGGRTSHAAIVSRELGIPAVVGTENATHLLEDSQKITISCSEGESGKIYEGGLDFEEQEINLEDVPEVKTQIMMNIASPAAAFRWWQLPCSGIGLARMEFIINNIIKIHPMALINYDELDDKDAKDEIAELTKNYDDKSEYFVDNLARGIAKIAASQYPDDVIVRMSDFKTNEYAELIGGEEFEADESNPMLGFRGASRYYSERYRPGFELECRAIKKMREKLGFRNVKVMIPFCRTLEEADKVLEVMSENGLRRGEEELEIYVMCEIPSNVILADEFSGKFDGFSIGSNDLTQLVLGVDRDSEELSGLFDERNDAVKRAVIDLINRAHEHNTKVGICGQAPSDYPEFAEFLVRAGIDSISLNPDSVIEVIEKISKIE